MGIISQYKVSLASLPEGKVEQVFVCKKDFFEAMENESVLDSDVEARLEIVHKNSAYDCTFYIQGEISVACDRCLEPMKHAVDTDYHLTVKYGYEYDDSNDELLILPESETNLDVAQLIHDSIVLTLPIRCVHQEGECNPEMEHMLSLHSSNSDEEYEEREEDSFVD